jgi:lipopolysaccharide transport system ATP-binding protein
MSDPAISVRAVGKRYELGGQKRLDQTLPETIASMCRGVFNRTPKKKQDTQSFWALRDISFDVAQGEVIGIIGHNGAGKSTLLKILSQITDPTEGEADLRGRVGSLLEVGTGFHPELSGRENIYLNGAILGMTRREIAAKFDEIVDFSGVEQFLDTPVKRYSSGMTVRLAFAVAAHLDPEILIVDEVLAVGDAEFQEKCLGKMRAVAGGEGRTVLFVSHNMAAVSALCDRAILLDGGRVVEDGPANDVVDQYLGRLTQSTSAIFVCDGPPRAPAWIERAVLRDTAERAGDNFRMSDPIEVAIDLHVAERSNLSLSIQVQEMNHSPVFHFHTVDARFDVPSTPGNHQLVAALPAMQLYPGEYLAKVTLSDSAGNRYQNLHATTPLRFEIRQDPAVCVRPLRRQAGLIYATCDWRREGRAELAA